MKNFILFGPPGVGKSTLIGTLKTRGISAIDLEDLYPNRIRFQIPNLVQGTVLGAADLNPQRRYNNCVKILLMAHQKEYDLRRKHRDADVPSKQNQKPHLMADWLSNGEFDYIVDTTHQSSQATASEIATIMEKEGALCLES